jgi:hypothetical protein
MCNVFIYTPPIHARTPPTGVISAFDIHPHVLASFSRRASSLADARFVYYNFSLTFRGGSRYAAFDHLLELRKRVDSAKPIVAPYFSKHTRIRGDRPSSIPGVLWLFEMSGEPTNIITPHSVSPSAVAAARSRSLSALPAPPKKELFFCGHVPKLYISSVRYQLWAQLVRRTEEATVCSHTLLHQGPYADCHHSGAWKELRTRLGADLPGAQRPLASLASLQPPKSPKSTESLQTLNYCRVYAKHRFYETIKLAGRAILPRSLSASDFFALEMAHQFCVVAPGDFPSTPKIGETLVASALGGCIPVIIKPQRIAIPYFDEYLKCAVRWDSLNASALLGHLAAVGAAERRRLRSCAAKLAPRFLYRPVEGLPAEAGDALLDTLCKK